MELQIINISLLGSLTFVIKSVRQKGSNSNSFAALLTFFLLMIPVAVIAAEFNTCIMQKKFLLKLRCKRMYQRDLLYSLNGQNKI